MARYCLFAALFIIVLTPHYISADVYIWTDANGIKHYSNTPPCNQKHEIQEEIKSSPQSHYREREQPDGYDPFFNDSNTYNNRKSYTPPPKQQRSVSPRYTITQVSIESVRGDSIRVSGRISGDYCPELTMTISIISESGRKMKLDAIVKDAGSNASSLFETKKHVGPKSAQQRWEFAEVSYYCNK